MFSLTGKKVWVAGHRGMVGSALIRRLASEACTVVTAERAQVDLISQEATHRFVADEQPQVVIIAAAKVGGIAANARYPVDFLYHNLMIQSNIMVASHKYNVQKLLFLGSSCIYPKFAPQPITEDALLTGSLEPTNEWYAIAKIAGIKLAQAYRIQHGRDFISAMPTNLYGPCDNFDLETSHVMPALIRKIHEAKQNGSPNVTVWGTGTPRREFMHVDDCADALIHALHHYSELEHINIGTNQDITISELAHMIADIVGFRGGIVHDHSKPDGTPRKLMSSERLRHLGWEPRVSLKQGINHTYRWYLDQSQQAPNDHDRSAPVFDGMTAEP